MLTPKPPGNGVVSFRLKPMQGQGVRRPLLRWAGSKRRLLPKLLACAPKSFNTYIEPFAGAACLFLAVHPERAVLGDLNSELIHFYSTLRRSPSELAARVGRMPATAEFYYRLRAKHFVADPVERAARFLYLNRNCFNGVYRTNRSGQFNVPLGSKVGQMPALEEISAFAKFLRGVRFVDGDFEKTVNFAKSSDFVYLDPPYTLAADRYRGEYGYASFSDRDLSRFMESVHAADRRGAHILISYRFDRRLQESLPGWSFRRLTVRRHVAGFAASRANAFEMLAANYALPHLAAHT